MRRPTNMPPRLPTPARSGNVPARPADGFGAVTKMPGRAASHVASDAQRYMPTNDRMAAQVTAMSGMRDVIGNDEAARFRGTDLAPIGGDMPEDRNSQNLPAVISRAIAAGGDRFQPRWHMIRRLPGYLQEPIRGMARPIFREFTSTPIEDLQVLSTASNSEFEVKMMMSWIAKHGTRVDEADIDLSGMVPGYRAKAQKWTAEEYTFLLVKDEWGHYVYGWPREHDLDLDHDRRPALPGR